MTRAAGTAARHLTGVLSPLVLAAGCAQGAGDAANGQAAAAGSDRKGATLSVRDQPVTAVQRRAEAAGLPLQMRAGRWQSTMTVTDRSRPGEAVQAQPGKTTSQTVVMCVTPEMVAARSGPDAQRYAEQMQAGCTYERFDMVGNKVESVMLCRRDNMVMRVTEVAEYAADTQKSHSLTEGMEASGPADVLAGGRAETRTESRRTGECIAGEPNG